MANILIHPNSGIIEFSTGTAGGGQFNPNFTGGAFASRLNYDNFGGLNFTSYVSNPTGLDRFSVDGANGRLFSVTDSLSGSLFSVNDIAGLPIIEAFDDNTVIMGAFNRNDFIITGNSVGIGALPNTGTQKLFVSGNFAVSGSSVFSIRPTVNGTGVLLSGEAATPQNLATTGSTLDTKINSLSGYVNSSNSNIVFTTGSQTISSVKTFSSGAAVGLASSATPSSLNGARGLQFPNIGGNGDGVIYGAYNGYNKIGIGISPSAGAISDIIEFNPTQILGSVPILALNLIYNTGNQTVSGIKNFISRPTVNNTGVVLSGEAATPANLATTGSTLNTRINNLSGYINSTGSNIVFTTGNQTITGQKIFQDKLLVGLTTPDAVTPDNRLQTNSLTIAGVDLTAGGQVPSTVIKGGVFLGKSDGSLGILTNSNEVWGPEAFEFAGVNFDVTAYNNMYFTAGYLPQFWLDTNGNVGIDTAYPTERLEVNGNVLGNNLVYNTGDQTINGLKSFVNSAPSTSVIASFDGDYGNPLEIITTDEDLSVGYGSSAYAIGVSSQGFAVKYSSSISDWGQPILVTEGGATVVRPASTITFSQPLLAPNLVYSSGDYNYFTTSITLGNIYINLANSTSGITATLPSIASGRNYIVKNLNTGTLTVTGSNFIDGNVNLKLYKNESAHLLGVRNIGFTGWVSLNTNPGIS